LKHTGNPSTSKTHNLLVYILSVLSSHSTIISSNPSHCAFTPNTLFIVPKIFNNGHISIKICFPPYCFDHITSPFEKTVTISLSPSLLISIESDLMIVLLGSLTIVCPGPSSRFAHESVVLFDNLVMSGSP
jgi:hypothetical protein